MLLTHLDNVTGIKIRANRINAKTGSKETFKLG
jgi:hypothetical protein